jgi:hypothetical protein
MFFGVIMEIKEEEKAIVVNPVADDVHAAYNAPPHPNLIKLWQSFKQMVAALCGIVTKYLYGLHIGSIMVVIGLLTSTMPTIASMPDDAHVDNRTALYSQGNRLKDGRP